MISRLLRMAVHAQSDAASLRLILAAHKVIPMEELNRARQQAFSQMEQQLEPLTRIDSLTLEELEQLFPPAKPSIQ